MFFRLPTKDIRKVAIWLLIIFCCVPAQLAFAQSEAAQRTTKTYFKPKPQLKALTPSYDGQVPGAKRTTFKLGQPLTGGVSMNVPRTPEDVARYLARMRQIIQGYQRLAVAAIFRGNSNDPSLDSINEVTGHTMHMIREIRAIVPPAEMKNEHYDLANTLTYFGQFVENPGSLAGGGFAAMAQLAPMMQRLSATLTNYHAGVRRVLTAYKLGPEYDPFGEDNPEIRRRLSGTVDSMTGRLMNQAAGPCIECPPGMSGLSGMSGIPGMGDMDLSQLGSLGNMDLGSLGSLGDLQNMDMESLSKMMGQLGGGGISSGHGDSHAGQTNPMDSINNLNQLLEQLNH